MRKAREQVPLFRYMMDRPETRDLDAAIALWHLQNEEDTWLSISPEDSRDILRWERCRGKGISKARLKGLKALHPSIFAEIREADIEARRKSKEEKERKREAWIRGDDLEFGDHSKAEQVLGVSKYASTEVKRSAYRALVQVHHPDHGGNREQFEAIQKAYEEITA